MRATSALVILSSSLLALIAGLARAQVVPGHSVTVYATVTDPAHLSFDRATGVLYTGRDNAGSGGGNGDAVKIHKIASGGSPVTEYSATAIPDPDAVFFDAAGTASEGAAGSVIVGLVAPGAIPGRLDAVRPNGTVQTIDGPSSAYKNPTDFVEDSTGRVLMTDATSSSPDRCWW